MNQRFEVGDRVVVVKTLADELRGQEAEVVLIVGARWNRSPEWYRVRLGSKRELYFRGSQLDHQKRENCVSNTE